jgi:hypothetical protein
MNKRRISMVMIVFLLILAALACEDTATPFVNEQPFDASSPYNQETLQVANAAAQATLAAGQREAMDLSYQATVISQNMDQAAKAAAQTTLEYSQRQLMDLSIRATEVSQSLTQAAATQQFVAVQTQMKGNAAATAQSGAATATYSVYLFNYTQTVHAQAMLDNRATYIAQANATLTAYPLTATPWAALQANVLRLQKEADQRAWWKQFVVTPLTVALLTLVVLLLIVGGVIAYWQLLPALELRLRTISGDYVRPPYLLDGTIVDANPSQLPLVSDGAPQVEIVSPSEPSVVNWITEAEQELRSSGRMPL